MPQKPRKGKVFGVATVVWNTKEADKIKTLPRAHSPVSIGSHQSPWLREASGEVEGRRCIAIERAVREGGKRILPIRKLDWRSLIFQAQIDRVRCTEKGRESWGSFKKKKKGEKNLEDVYLEHIYMLRGRRQQSEEIPEKYCQKRVTKQLGVKRQKEMDELSIKTKYPL